MYQKVSFFPYFFYLCIKNLIYSEKFRKKPHQSNQSKEFFEWKKKHLWRLLENDSKHGIPPTTTKTTTKTVHSSKLWKNNKIIIIKYSWFRVMNGWNIQSHDAHWHLTAIFPLEKISVTQCNSEIWCYKCEQMKMLAVKGS